MNVSNKAIVMLLAVGGLLFSSASAAAQDLITEVDRFAQQIQRELQIQSGFALGVVKSGELILLRQYGWLNAERQIPLKSDTPFYIASTTKSFVGLLAVILAEKGYFKLDEPISRYLPELKFSDAKLNADRITMRDLLNHVHGVSNEIVTFNTAYSGLKISDPELLAAFQRESSVTTREFAYSNVGYVLAGLVIKRTTGKTWQVNLKTHVLRPANLYVTSPYVTDFAPSRLPLAHYSFRREQGFAQQPFIKNNLTMHAAGGMLSTVRDAVRWITIHLQKGRLENVPVFPERYFAETLKPQASLKATFFNYERSHYGFGWYHAKLGQYAMIHSFGGFLGARSHISFLPDQQVGVCVFINESGRGSNVPELMANYLYGLLLRDEQLLADTRAELAKQARAFHEALAKPTASTAPVVLAASEVNKLAGVYEHPELGRLVIKAVGRGLWIELGNIKTRATPTSRTKFETDFPYFYQFEFSAVGVELNDGGKYQFTRLDRKR